MVFLYDLFWLEGLLLDWWVIFGVFFVDVEVRFVFGIELWVCDGCGVNLWVFCLQCMVIVCDVVKGIGDILFGICLLEWSIVIGVWVQGMVIWDVVRCLLMQYGCECL